MKSHNSKFAGAGARILISGAMLFAIASGVACGADNSQDELDLNNLLTLNSLTNNCSSSGSDDCGNESSETSQPKMLFHTDRNGGLEVYEYEPGDNELKRLTSAAGTNSFPRWARSSSTAGDNDDLVFQSNRTGQDEIFLMTDSGTTTTTRITTNQGTQPDLLYVSGSTTNRIVFATTRDGNSEIYVVNTDKSGLTRLTNNTAADSYPRWSPDGTKIVFQSDRDGSNQVYVMNADGTSQTRLTNLASNGEQPNWSPDGTKIVYVTTAGDTEIAIMNADGSGATTLTANTAQDAAPAIHPTDNRIYFQTNRDGVYNIYSMAMDGTGQTSFLTSASNDYAPAW